jgi:hypothetical protein
MNESNRPRSAHPGIEGEQRSPVPEQQHALETIWRAGHDARAALLEARQELLGALEQLRDLLDEETEAVNQSRRACEHFEELARELEDAAGLEHDDATDAGDDASAKPAASDEVEVSVETASDDAVAVRAWAASGDEGEPGSEEEPPVRRGWRARPRRRRPSGGR